MKKNKKNMKRNQEEVVSEEEEAKEEKKKVEKGLLEDLKSDKKFSKMLLTTGDDPSLKIEKIPFGIEVLDDLLCGGLPVGKMSLLYGDFSVGKTFLAQKFTQNAQKLGKEVVLVDVDKSYEPRWWETTGVDTKKLFVSQPAYGEQASDLVIALLERGTDVVILDSIDLLIPTAEVEVSMEQNFMGLKAKLVNRLMGQTKRANYRTTFIALNHIREGLGKYSQFTLPGGKAQSECASLMLWVYKGPIIKEDEIKRGGDENKKVGFKMKVTLEKDKIEGKRYDYREMPFLFEGGVIDSLAGVIEIAMNLGLIKKTGAMYDFEGQNVRGILGVKDFLLEHEDILNILKEKIKVGKA